MAEVSKATLVLSGSTRGLRRAMSKAKRSMRGAASQMKARVRRLGKAIGAAMATAGGAMVAFAAKSTQMAARFEKNMVKVNTLVGLSRERVQGMRDDVLSLAQQTGQAPTKLAKALFRLTSGGIRGAEALDALEKSAQGARIGMGEVNELARLATSSVQAFESQGADMNSVLNTIFGTIREGNVRVGRLQSAFGMLQTVAADAGVTMQDMGAFLAATSRTMGDTSKAARGLRQFLVRLQDPTGDMPEAFEAAGISVSEFRQQIQQQGLPRALVNLARAAEENGVEFAKMVSSTESLPAILTAARTSSEEFLEISDRMTETQSEFSDAVEETSRTLSDQIGRLRESARAAAIQIGERLSGSVGDFAEKVRRNLPQIAATVSQMMGRVGNAILDTINFFRENQLVGEFGLVGLALFGPKGAAAFAALGAMIDDLINRLVGPTTELGVQQDRIAMVEEQIRNVQRIMDAGEGSTVFGMSQFENMAEAESRLHELQERLGLLRATLARNREEMAGTTGAFSELEQSARKTFDALEGARASDFGVGGGGASGGEGGGLDTDEFGIVRQARGVTEPLRNRLAKLQTALVEAGPVDLSDAIKRQVEEAEDAGQQAMGRMETTLQRAGRSAIRGLVEGFVRGADDLGERLERVMKNLVESAITAQITSMLGIASPSKVARGWGASIAQGLALGVTDQQMSVADAMTATVNVATPEAAVASAPRDGGVQTRRVVPDFSEVELPRAVTPREQALNDSWLQIIRETNRQLDDGGAR